MHPQRFRTASFPGRPDGSGVRRQILQHGGRASNTLYAQYIRNRNERKQRNHGGESRRRSGSDKGESNRSRHGMPREDKKQSADTGAARCRNNHSRNRPEVSQYQRISAWEKGGDTGLRRHRPDNGSSVRAGRR